MVKMGKQNFCLKKSFVSEFVFVLSGALVILFAFLIMLPQVETNSHAEGETTDEGIVIVFSPEIDVSLKSSDDGYYKIVKDTVEISTSSQNGYTLYLSTDTAEHQDIYLNGDTSSSSKISGTSGTYESPKPLEDYTWGWAVPGMSHFNDSYDTENPSVDAKFAATPLSNQIIRDYIEPATGDTAEVYYGFKLGGELETGNYETNITYTAVPATQPLVARAILGDNGNLNFVYDRKSYAVDDVYTDNLNETAITGVYEVPLSCANSTPWSFKHESIISANVDQSFVNARPTATCLWFGRLDKVASITNLQNLNTSNVTIMREMFRDAGYNANTFSIGDLSGWDTSKVTNMQSLFNNAGYSATTWDVGDLSGWDTGNVTNMQLMFRYAGYNATTFSLDISDWNTNKVTAMDNMFSYAGYNATTFSLDLSGWNTGNVTGMFGMFLGAGYSATTWSIGDLGDWNTGKVTNMSSLFLNAGHNATTWSIGNLADWNTGNVEDMQSVFSGAGYNAATWNIGDISGWNTLKVRRMGNMFFDAGHNATTWYIGNISYSNPGRTGWRVNRVGNYANFVNKEENNTTIQTDEDLPNRSWSFRNI